MDPRISKIFIPHLRSQFERGLPVLVTGAGFSLGAKNVLGSRLPTVEDLKRQTLGALFSGRQI